MKSPEELTHAWMHLLNEVSDAERLILQTLRISKDLPEIREEAATNYQLVFTALEDLQHTLNKVYPPEPDKVWTWNLALV